MFTKQTIRDVDLRGKTVLVRADYNVPVKDGKITDDYRIQQSLPTLKYLIEQDAKIIVCSHLGRPKGPGDASASLFPVAKRLRELLDREIQFETDCVGERVAKAASSLHPGQILLLENLRFHPEEEANDAEFARQLASVAEIFAQDGFGVVHRAHASTEGVTHYLPSVAGLLLEKEVDTITNVMGNPKKPLMAVIGGAKIADKIEIIDKFIKIADVIAIGGAMANTFLKAQGINVGASLYDKEELSVAKDIIHRAAEESKQRRFVFYIPQDGVVATKIDPAAPTRIVDWSAHLIAQVENYPKRAPHAASHVGEHEMILDVGPFSGAFIAGAMQLVETVVWNGTLGVTETKGLTGPVGPYSHGTDLIMETMLGKFIDGQQRPFSVVGGGDTVGYVQSRKLTDAFDHVSTGGGASLELMGGRQLPGVKALRDKS